MSKNSKEYMQEVLDLLNQASEKFDIADFHSESVLLQKAKNRLNDAITLSERQLMYKGFKVNDPVKAATSVYK